MKRTVLFVTSPTAVDALPTLQNLTGRAVGQQVRVNVWIVASTDFFSSSGATALKDLAIQTGGQYVLFSGVEPLPGLETYFAPLRSTYQLTYTSGILTSGGPYPDGADQPGRANSLFCGPDVFAGYPAAEPHPGCAAGADRPPGAG